LQPGFTDELAITELRVTNDPVSLKVNTLRTAFSAGLRAKLPPTEPAHLVVAFWDSPLSHGINVFVGIVLCFTMLGLGCTVDVSQLGEHIRRPIGVLLALVCQFVIMPLVAFLLALAFSLDDVAAMAVLLCGCCPGGNLSIMSLLVNGEMNLSIIMTISSTALARAWINTPVVNLMPFGAIILTLCSTLIPIGLGVMLRYRYNRAADIVLKVSLWSLLVTLVMLFIMTGAMLGPELLATIPPRRTVSLETGCHPEDGLPTTADGGGVYMFPLLYALFQATIFILAYRMYRKEVLHKPVRAGTRTRLSILEFEDEDMGFDTSYGAVTTSDPNLIMLEPCPDSTPV
uniref:Solute carrier family 10 member 4 n=1 Tax=Hucho hucho TaxID=62062 RepID=A0A4W5K464_9TELE